MKANACTHLYSVVCKILHAAQASSPVCATLAFTQGSNYSNDPSHKNIQISANAGMILLALDWLFRLVQWLHPSWVSGRFITADKSIITLELKWQKVSQKISFFSLTKGNLVFVITYIGMTPRLANCKLSFTKGTA